MRIRLRELSGVVVLVGVTVSANAQDVRLATAAEHRDMTAVEALLAQGADVNGPQPDGATALHWAAHWNDLALTEALIAAGADVDAANEYGVTPLSLAATNGSARVLDALLRAGANARAALPTGETALMTAVRSGRVDAVNRLLAGGADPNAKQTSKGQTALMWAATAQKPEIARSLIANGAQVDARSVTGFTALMFAAREGGLELAQLLLESGADINAAARCQGDPSAYAGVTTLCSASDGNTPLLVATVRGHVDLAIFLVGQGAQPDGAVDVAGYTPLHWACARYEHPLAFGDVTVELALTGEWRALAGIPDRDPKLALIRALLAHGANLEALVTRPGGTRGFRGSSMSRGATPYFVAAMAGDAKLMRLLLANGANPLVRSTDASTVLMGAIRGGNAFSAHRVTEQDRIEAIEVALETGNDIEAQDQTGYRAMHVAAAAEFHQVILFLLEQGADLNPVTQSRRRTEGSGFVVIAGQSPLGIVEGTFTGGSYNERPETAAFLRGLGAESIGRATLQTYLDSFTEGTLEEETEENEVQDPRP